MISVIIPIWNIEKRGFRRLDMSLLSIKKNSLPVEITVIDGSHNLTEAREICQKHGARHIYIPQDILNMPALYNRGASISAGKYLYFTGADFVYGKDFFSNLKKILGPSKIVLTSVLMGAQTAMFTEQTITEWDSSKFALRNNKEDQATQKVRNWGTWGEYAPGLACYDRELFAKTGGYDEKFVGISAFDNDMIWRCEIMSSYGQPIKKQWTRSKDVYHIWHKPYKLSGPLRKYRDKNHIRQAALREDWKLNSAKYVSKGIEMYNWKNRTL